MNTEYITRQEFKEEIRKLKQANEEKVMAQIMISERNFKDQIRRLDFRFVH